MRVCLIQGREQQQNWVLGSGVLAPYLDLGFFFPRTSQNVFSVSGTMVSPLHWRFIKMRIIKMRTYSCHQEQ